MIKQGKSEGFDSCDWPSNLTQIGFKSSIFQPVTLKFNGWPRKIIGHLFYTTSSFVHHFKSIGEFKLELQSRNAQFGSKSMILFSCVTLKFDEWLWKTIAGLPTSKILFPYFVEKISVFWVTFPYPLICSSPDSKLNFLFTLVGPIHSQWKL